MCQAPSPPPLQHCAYTQQPKFCIVMWWNAGVFCSLLDPTWERRLCSSNPLINHSNPHVLLAALQFWKKRNLVLIFLSQKDKGLSGQLYQTRGPLNSSGYATQVCFSSHSVLYTQTLEDSCAFPELSSPPSPGTQEILLCLYVILN